MIKAEIPETEIRANARLELLRCLAFARDWHRARVAEDLAAGKPDLWGPEHVPLHCGEFRNPVADIDLAAKECAAIGEIELVHAKDGIEPNGPAVVITDKGYDWIRAYDALGEAQQEARA